MVRVSRMVTADSDVPEDDRRQDHLASGCAVGPAGKARTSRSGDQPHQIDGNTITMVPIQKLGTASIRMENERPT